MEVRRQEGRERASRSRKDPSNKENICPLQGRDTNVAEMTCRRSPLPEGFPRSPLQDITHIVCPHNIWPNDEDPPIDPMRKKLRKDNSLKSCTGNETGSNWKGLAACAHIKFGAQLVQTEEVVKETDNSKLNTDARAIAVCDNAKKIDKCEDLCIYRDNAVALCGNAKKIGKCEELYIHRDDALNDPISRPDCEIMGVQHAMRLEESKELGALDTRAEIIEHRQSYAEYHADLKQESIGAKCAHTIVSKESYAGLEQQSDNDKYLQTIVSKDCHASLEKQNDSGKCLRTIVGNENLNKRAQHPMQPKKKSSLLMLR